jgi:chemotaxis regulatin CheY-phosphate phosphatase CheZ
MNKDKQARDGAPPAKDIHAEGPYVPGTGKSNMVSGQDEVDDLLSSLGF